ncbi:hypothetical protein H4I96_07453 [Botrytis cinerea]
MRFVLAANWYILLWATTTVAVPTSDQLLQRAVPIPPTDDPFYVPPTALENSQPERQIAWGYISSGHNNHCAKKCEFIEAAILPNGDRCCVAKLCTILYITVGVKFKKWGSGAAETLLVIAALNQGWIVNLPDYEGLESAFTSGIQAGQATLDSVRAALSSGDLTSISSQAEYQMWGYSGGSLASEWAAELQPSYAPELNFKGTALGGLVPNITSVMLSSNKGLFTGLIPAGVIGLTNGYPVLKEYLHKNLVPSTASKFYKASTQCLGSNIASFLGQDIGLYLDHGLSTLFTSIAKDVLAITGQMGLYGTPKMPIFLYKAISDEVSVVGDTDAVVSKLCSQGANINYARDMFGAMLPKQSLALVMRLRF